MLEPKNLFRVVQDMALSHFEAHDPRSGVICLSLFQAVPG